eukprot:TRINITY_DN1659_c0_g1_i1.p1 TRINITY_DN1659_c0_g1~~TRINITY_DN1659_c0_g1_i1.p1  ORF type:complete len:344 (-),score=58.16 TRINITY_DN1659_c0_g1_i1:45-1076(-)
MRHHGGAKTMRTVPHLLREGITIRAKWKVVQCIGIGSYGEIYSAINTQTNDMVALKVEEVDSAKQSLQSEVAALRYLQGVPFVCEYISCGRFESLNYAVLQLLGENLADIRKRQPGQKFSLISSVRMMIQSLECIRALHEKNIIHRDVKPSNFVMGPDKTNPTYPPRLYVIDFGLSRKYLLPDGTHKPPRENAGFRGTARYASVFSHRNMELSRRDDIWSIFYMGIEFVTGTLPWRSQSEKERIGEIKQKYLNPSLVENLPEEFEMFFNHLMSLKYESAPDYDFICNTFQNLLKKIGGEAAAPYDFCTSTQELIQPKRCDLERPFSEKKAIEKDDGDKKCAVM